MYVTLHRTDPRRARRADPREAVYGIQANFGRRLATLRPAMTEWASLVPLPRTDEEPRKVDEIYAEPIAALLQASRLEGLSPNDVLDQAVSIAGYVWDQALDCAREGGRGGDPKRASFL